MEVSNTKKLGVFKSERIWEGEKRMENVEGTGTGHGANGGQ